MSKPVKKIKQKTKMKTKPQKPSLVKNFKDFCVREFNYFKKGEKRLSAEFMGGITVMLIAVLLTVAIAILSASQKVTNETDRQLNYFRDAISSNLVEIVSSRMQNNEAAVLGDTVITMIKSKVLGYFILTDIADGKILFSTIENPILSQESPSPASLEKNNLTDTVCIVKTTDKFKIYLGFIEDRTLYEDMKKLSRNLSLVFILCLSLGMWLAYVLSTKVIKPLSSMIKVTAAFSSGDLSDRLERTKYIEINELVESYNSMADSIQQLYSTLEHQVRERTVQLQDAIKEIQNTQAMMVHSEKMKSLGELVAGIMHEINNPINFIYGNLSHLKNYSADLITLIDSFEDYTGDLTPEHKAALEKLKTEIDYEFLKTDLPDLIKSCHEGTERTKNIILNLKDFSRMEEAALTNVDLAKEIDTTLNILNNKFKNKIKLTKEYAENLPKIEAYGGQLNQVFMNILDNAAFAVTGKEDAEVKIKISSNSKFAMIEISDNGKGMDKTTKDKIFNPFFTTKPVGQGTGLGLSISYKVIKNHNGEIEVNSEPGSGTTFTIKLPLIFEKQEKVADEKKKEDEDVIEVI